MRRMTSQTQEMLDLLKHLNDKGDYPTLTDLLPHCHIALPTIYHHVKRLIQAGLVMKKPYIKRTANTQIIEQRYKLTAKGKRYYN